MTLTTGLMSSLTDDWETPQDLFNLLDAEFKFTLDVCASESNHKVDYYYTKEQDGLKQSWDNHICWMNPPYGRVIGQWVKKANDTANRGGVVVGLLPARTDTKWWGDVMKATEIRFIKGRVKFGGAAQGAPFPSVVVIWGTPHQPIVKMLDLHAMGGE